MRTPQRAASLNPLSCLAPKSKPCRRGWTLTTQYYMPVQVQHPHTSNKPRNENPFHSKASKHSHPRNCHAQQGSSHSLTPFNSIIYDPLEHTSAQHRLYAHNGKALISISSRKRSLGALPANSTVTHVFASLSASGQPPRLPANSALLPAVFLLVAIQSHPLYQYNI